MITIPRQYYQRTDKQISFAAKQSFYDGLIRRIKGAHFFSIVVLIIFGVLICSDALAAYPNQDTEVGDVVTNPETGEDVIVVELVLDPPEAETDPPEITYVNTSDDYFILVKNQVGDLIYVVDEENNLVTYKVVATDEESGLADLQLADDPQAEIQTIPYAAEMVQEQDPGEIINNPDNSGVRIVYKAPGGAHGSWGTLFVPPTAGHRGTDGDTVTYKNTEYILTDNKIGIEAGSIGGNGGGGGDSYGSFWNGKRGGDGGKGGEVIVTNEADGIIKTTGSNAHGIFAYSRSGQAGHGGSGYVWSGGGAGGHASDGGNVTVTNKGMIQTDGDGAHGIYALSVSGNGGTGGDSWGIVGASGSGNAGGNGGTVTVINDGTIRTAGANAQGILAQSIGGTGGSAGDSGGLLAFSGTGEAGGNGGEVNVTNNGSITTTGNYSRGIFAQSIGGGGGSGGDAGGLLALGGVGAGGGNSGKVTVINSTSGHITTTAVGSDGVFAQSVGGSGGGGSNSGGLVAIGGDGAVGGNGGEVVATNLGVIETEGDYARGLVAESIGGGGGDGGSSGGMVAVGGSGEGGGYSATVSVTQAGRITTMGNDASGIFAQSVGGGGGNGGSAGSVSAFAGVAVGGKGGPGGAGGDVNLNMQGTDGGSGSLIRTEGDRSTGIFAQSVGGGGGNGGGAVQATGGFMGAVSIAVGGAGGVGGDAGKVIVSQGDGPSIIETGGTDATGMFLQSVGGGGGNGGYAVSIAASGGPVSGSVSVGIGGKGGAGGEGGEVYVGSFDEEGNQVKPGFSGSILTKGERSPGLIAQSVGGGGGNGGLAISAAVSGGAIASGSVSVGVGGDGGKGGAGGTVSVGVQGNITTEEAYSPGMLVQSVGGGGGNGGGAISGALAAAGVGAGSVAVGLGGNGGEGNAGGEVTLTTREGTITTKGDNSTGITAQSIGGGGGNGGYSVAIGLAGAGVGAGAVTVGLGGSGGKGADGGTVTADLQSDVFTMGDYSGGLLAQSVGGGGGNGGFSVSAGAAGAGTGAGTVSVGLGGAGEDGGLGGSVEATSTGTIHTMGDHSNGFVAQSIGGGGGNGGFSIAGSISGGGVGSGAISVGLGGNGGGGSDASIVKASTSGDIITEGVSSTGILAQSVGGGGGNGGFNVSVALSGAGTGSGAVGVGLGGKGAGGGNGSEVDLMVDNNVSTLNNDSTAVIAQSIGGGGGNGGFNVTVAGSGAGTGSGAVGVGIGGSGGGGGDSGKVTSIMTGDILTMGENSSGLLVQSIGGGGGNGGFNVTAAISVAGSGSGGAAVGIGGSAGDGGFSGAVDSSFTGDIFTMGKHAPAVTAQSLGGGGGNGGLSIAGTISGAGKGSGAASIGIGGAGGGGGNSSTVKNTVTGDISTSGLGSTGVLAQSLGGGGGNGGLNVSGSISVAGQDSGAVSVGIGGSGGDGGDSMKVTNKVTGTVMTGGAEATAIIAQSLGGGGGNGGINVTGTIAASAEDKAGAIGVGVGGSGGGGGDGGEVDNTVSGYVQTSGDNSIGILAQSLGGGGGNGGLNVTGTITATNKGSGGLAVGVGGFGGDGGDAAEVWNTVIGGTVTTGDNANGIVAQSLGGGGGNGGINVTASMNFTKENGGTLGVGIGGFGGNGGDAGDVTSLVTTTAEYSQIATTGDDSSAIIAQSIGGGGGNGGLNVTGSVNATGKNGAAIGVGVGGFGGGAGDAGNVTLGVTGDIITEGNNSHGLIAQSIGGGGGNGGTNVTGSLAITKPASEDSSTTVAASIGIGGFGGGGGDAGDVDLDFSGTIVAQPRVLVGQAFDPESGETIPEHYEFKEGSGSHGILAQSLGGGGGNGGINVSAGISYAAGESDGHALLVGFGGFGGDGGNAGNVDVSVRGGQSISAYGAGNAAIMAQSAGGGGGNGALNVSGGVVSDSPLIVGVGGMGGNGGVGGDVKVRAATDVYTIASPDDETHSAGILAQSLGGGGGNGGINISGGISIDKGKAPSITVGVGGFGGTGSQSGDVDVFHVGNATTVGGWTHGIFAQSVAGGGGNGGLNVSGQFNWADSENSGGAKDLSIAAGIGGHGGSGADAGAVTVFSLGDSITTSGDYSRGIYAQSIGGGGGTGGMNVTGVFAKNSSPITLGIGGFGSGGGNAGSVSVVRGMTALANGKITTEGVGAIGIEASSIGGGGGDAGMNFVVGISLAADSQGDNGGSEGGTSSTREHPKHTGVDESVFTNYDKVLDELEGKSPADSEDKNDASKDSPFAAQIAIGGSAGDAGHGNLATVDNYGDIETYGNDSHGILAQSIGGGGGNANLNLAATYQGKSDDSKGFNFTLGGATGDGGNGAKVQLDHEGVILTRGEDAYGLFAQSVGGGGGNVGYDFNTMQTKGGKIGINLGRKGGTGGFGDDVSLTSQGTVATLGNRSYGILAQSIGNGGGNSSSTTISAEISGDEEDGTPSRAATITVGLEGGQGGSAGNVDVQVGGMVSTLGESAHAIFAQSVGGGGGNAGDAKSKASTVAISLGASGGEGGIGGKINVTNSAVIQTQGQDALGILAQSVGGGGGTGSMTESKAEDFAIAVGGGGGDGATSDDVTVTNRGDILTECEGSYAILAQSIGGGGGNAKSTKSTLEKKKPKEKQSDSVVTSAEQGDGETEEASSAVQVSLAVGGQGGTGATSGNVKVENYGSIATTGNQAIGIFAQSIGGGGGNAAQATSSVTSELGSGFLLGIGIGGTGGEGGQGGDVVVSNLVDPDAGQKGQIITLGDGAHGIFAMSIGGGGGNGSTVIAKTNAKNQNEKNAASAFAVGIGGSGGIGGTGGEVTVTNAGQIATYGAKAHGIIAQSIGGGGGNGGLTISGNQAMGSQEAGSKAGSFALGGSGGDGNTAGDVTVINTGTIEVFGNESYGIYAQSVGGGGGDGALTVGLSADLFSNPFTNLAPSLMNIGIGGSGGDGGNGGNIFINQKGSIIGHGDNAYGIYAQSVGGGGGNVGTSISSPVWMAADLGISALLGGRDGNNGDAGTVTINTIGDIIMTGANSQAYFTQAVNGGGGNLQLFLDVSEKGAAYGEDSTGLPEDLTFIEQITAKLSSEFGLGAEQSSGSSGSEVQASHAGNLYTGGDRSIASSTQSIGGGGGSANIGIVTNSEANADFNLMLGGKESSDNHGGDIELSRAGDIGTMGSQSPGVDVQSIGGGGGNLTLTITELPTTGEQSEEGTAGTAGTVTSQIRTSDLSAIPDGIVAASAEVGAKFSENNVGGDIRLTYSGDLETLGTLSPGLIVQTIGGGGGQISITGVDSFVASLGASGNSTGDGGRVELSNQGSIYTSGRLSHGIMIQSIGGGGGVIFTDLDQSSINLSLNDGGVGNGGDVKLTQAGDVVTSGPQAHGVFIQSIGGGGGAVDNLFAGTAGGQGSGGHITVALNDSVISSGPDANGVFLQSLGQSGTTNGDISLLINGDLVMGGAGAGIGVRIDGGFNNTLVNHATVQTLDGIIGQALVGSMGNEEIDNFGTINGNIDLGAGSNQIKNQSGALINSGSVIGLGFGNTLTNAGNLAPGGRDNELITNLTGNYVQLSEGKLDIDVDLSHEMGDSLSLTGTADLSGELIANPIKAGYAKPGEYDQVAVSAEAGVLGNSISLAAPASAVVSYDLVQLGQNDIAVRSNVDFNPERDGALDRNARRLAEHVNDIQSAGGSESFAPIAAALVALPDDDSLNTAYEHMNPEIYGNLVAETIAGNLKFNDRLHSCRQRDGNYRFMQEGECLWLRLDGGYRDQDHTSKNLGYDIDTVTLSGGYQWDLAGDNFLGFGLSYMYADLDGKWSDSNGSQVEGGLIYKRFYGANMFSGTLSAGYGWYDTDRDINLPTPGVEARSDQDIYFAALHGRYSHDFQPQANRYIRPILDLGFTRVHRESFDENGAGGANMDVNGETENFVTFQPAVEIGGEINLTSGTLLRPYVRLGITQFLTDNDQDITASLEGAPNGVGQFTIETEGDRTFGDLALGLDILQDNGVNTRIDYAGQISENTTSHYAGIKLSIPF